ncbi:MAG: hypothetical protein CGU28_06480 [Candidatus Dactylopiibacterium carminicum]|uniref:Uncharacterized protein n=1 Tax=Candidatus Dactylopiibacterium carminicum TaxID=857335 RepID=A0A272EWQ8_9RHOO|nr:hypothetical protein [Candidatus Dactylopiibacterium carminicum]KAF7599943.1 hypothetical protein BGI27_04960 [Candidatus Dactylopiibacterium carminicum]PAS94476.1 MAG: hypothetical protein CGU29_03980 [Candidatus Dactylopiibacterium carminicum]PAS97039.1 MAG: hypothetical protein CGU28_06480 [Candidatus Dactylopiibacterium carminicum]PAS99947.1 MAG: hypothetical protein BSR46_04995 [Candidatus Dactylopiibacterium carminicum]
MGLLDWFRQSTPKLDQTRVSSALVDETIDYVVKVTDARLPLVHHYRERLSGPVTRTLGYINELRDLVPAAHEVGPLSWSLDPSIRAFFARSKDMLETFASCKDLRAHAARAAVDEDIYAILAMDFNEQRRFGTAMQGSMMVREIPRTAFSFNKHRLRLFAPDEDTLRRAIARRLLDELALIALGTMQSEQETRRELENNRQLLSARLTTLRQRGMGMESFLGDAGVGEGDEEESSRLLRQLEENETRLAAMGNSAEALDRQLDYLAQVLAEPMNYISLEHRTAHLDSMNLVVDDKQGDPVEFNIANADRHPPWRRAFLPVRIDRALLGGPQRKLRLDNAERWL